MPAITTVGNRPARQTSTRRVQGIARAGALALLLLSVALPAHGWGRKVTLARKYRPGQTMVYETRMQTRAEVRSDPPGLKAFLPPVPTQFRAWQQNTVTIEAVHPDGTTDIRNRFDRFEFQSDLVEQMPEHLRDSARQAQQEFGHRVTGQALTAHYNRDGRLLGFEGVDEMLQQLDAPLRETMRQILRTFLEQMGGQTLYPDRRVKPGEEWKRSLAAQASDAYPFSVEGESTLHYSGKTKYRGVKAAIIEFRFQDVVTPALDSLRRAGPLAQLEAHGMELEIRIDGQGWGRALLALEDGRVLQNHTTLNQTLSARLKGFPALSVPIAQPVKLEIHSQTEMEVEESAK
jgi:hypothetical protein